MSSVLPMPVTPGVQTPPERSLGSHVVEAQGREPPAHESEPIAVLTVPAEVGEEEAARVIEKKDKDEG